MRLSVAAILAVLFVAGCSGSGAPTCGQSQIFTVAGYSTGSAADQFLPGNSSPYPASSTYIYFSTTGGPAQTAQYDPPTFAGTPMLTGSNGTMIAAGPLAGLYYTHDDATSLFGYASSISGLVPNVTYKVTFASLQDVQTGCRYGSESAGSFSTN